ncbi:MAG: hypothetical protein M3297_01905 [Thermoproteota archaeon]|nr:hypothetical protein [Thermoproteota archaeon]
MESDIQLLELAEGIKDALITPGFSSIKSIVGTSASDISGKVGVDLYNAQIILQEAKRIEIKMAAPPVIDSSLTDKANPAAVAVKKEEINFL